MVTQGKLCTKSNIFCRSVSGRRGVSTVESLRCTKYLLVSFYYLYIAYTKLCPSQCTNQRRFMTSPLVIQIYACIILHFILKFHHRQRYTCTVESSRCTNQRRFMTSPLVTNIQIFAWDENAKKCKFYPIPFHFDP